MTVRALAHLRAAQAAAPLFTLLSLAAAPAASAGSPAGVLTLAELERLALAGNPTLVQAASGVRAAAGRERQAGIYPNPILAWELGAIHTPGTPGSASAGASASGTSTRLRAPAEPPSGAPRATPPPTTPPVTPAAAAGTGVPGTPDSTLARNAVYLQVPIVTGGKLARGQALAAADRRLAESAARAQRQAVLTAVRSLYYEALGAARQVELAAALAALTAEAVAVSVQLANIGQADQPDLLEVEMEAERAQLELLQSRHEQERVWRTLGAMVGRPDLGPAPLAGDLEAGLPALDPAAVTAAVLRDSLALELARAHVERARATLERVRAERVPNLFVRARFGYLSEWFDLGRDAGYEAGIEVGVPLPLFDRQQGNLAAAHAALEHARAEAQRVELALRARLADALGAHADARSRADRYGQGILPRARRAWAVYREAFERRAAAYPQVLIARRTLLRAERDYARALVAVWRSAAAVESLLLPDALEAPTLGPAQVAPAGALLRSGGD